ncbi:MAG: hypothetical protein K2O32_12575 [Acetatifactor sp.]|nr:hypothetical protein [Acetatifactor sp.]
MAIALIVLWIVWSIPAVIYICGKRSDWYIWIFPPAAMTVLALCISILSRALAIITIIGIHVYLLVSCYIARKK